MSLKINILIDSLKEKYGELEVDGKYGEQCTIEKDGVILYRYIGLWKSYRNVWECSKRILDVKEDEKWMIKTKAKN